MAHPKEDYVFHQGLYGEPRRCILTEEDGSKVLMDLYISHEVVSGANKPGLAKCHYAVLNEVERPEVYEGMDKPYYYDPTTRKLYDSDGDVIHFEIITDASVSPCVGKATTPLSSPSSHTTSESESEESEQPEEPRYTLVPGIFKPTAKYPAVHSTTGVVAIGDGKFRCRFRKTPNGCLNTGSYTEEAFKAQFDLNSITKLKKEKAHPTILQKLPAAAAKPIASSEPHAKKNSNIPEFPEQAKEPDVIDLCESDGEEDQAKPPAPAATGKRPASPQPEKEPVSKRPGRKAADVARKPHIIERRVNITNSPQGSNSDFLNELLGGPDHLLRDKPSENPSPSHTPVCVDFGQTPAFERSPPYVEDIYPLELQMGVPAEDRARLMQAMRSTFKSPPESSLDNHSLHVQAMPGIQTDNDEPVRSSDGTDAGDPRMREALNNSAHVAGKRPIYSTCTHTFEFGTPTELPRQEVGDMSFEELQGRLNEVKKTKAQLQRTLHECGRHTERLKKAIRKREQRKKFDHHRKYVKGIHEALEQQHSSRIADMKKCYEKRQQKLAAATNIQAIARSTVNRMQYQKNLPIWKKTQAAMKLANEAEHQAAEAEREARRLRDAADKALSELNKLTNL